MTELFPPATPADVYVSLEDMIACVDREIGLRRTHYPRWTKQGKLTKAAADEEILKMMAVRSVLLDYNAMALAICPQCEILTMAYKKDLLKRYPEPT